MFAMAPTCIVQAKFSSSTRATVVGPCHLRERFGNKGLGFCSNKSKRFLCPSKNIRKDIHMTIFFLKKKKIGTPNFDNYYPLRPKIREPEVM